MSGGCSDIVKAQMYNGHKAVVNCLELDQSHVLGSGVFCSGSDDQTVRVWSLNTDKAVKCIAGCFESGIECMKFSQRNPHVLYVGSGSSVLNFDLRFSGVLSRSPISALRGIVDDVSGLAINPKDDSVAVSDENGVVTIVPISNNSLQPNDQYTKHRKLMRVHESIVGSLVYRQTNASELITGGYDCRCCLWDTALQRPRATLSFQNLAASLGGDSAKRSIISKSNSKKRNGAAEPATNNATGGQIFNPPFVQAMSYLHNGRLALAALGDGTLRILHARELQQLYCIDAHGGMVSAVFAANDLVVSGGVDHTIKAWHVSEGLAQCEVSGDLQPAPTNVAAYKALIDSNGGSEPSTTNQIEDLDTKSDITGSSNSSTVKTTFNGKKKSKKPKSLINEVGVTRLWETMHSHKVNALAAYDAADAIASLPIVVADTTSAIHLYTARA